MDLFSKKEDCCGCGACVQICPRHAISMREDEYGFIYPVIDEKLCVECGRCKAVCGYQNDAEVRTPIKSYAVADKDSERLRNSASGGAFAAIAAEVLEEGGVIFGAEMCMTEDGVKVCHTMIDSILRLPQLQGSKYVQSEIGNVYNEAVSMLKAGRKVLFSGTPCQIAGLKQFLSEKKVATNNLYTTDLICHGVPNQRMLNDYLSVLSEKVGARVERFDFRSKDHGWGLEGKYYYWKKGELKGKTISCRLSSYYRLFLASDTYRENCYSCHYARSERVSDITLGDYWGIEKEQPELLIQHGGVIDVDKGVSCLLINTDKGAELYEKAKDRMTTAEADFVKVQRNNDQLNEPVHRGKNRDKVFGLYKDGGFASVDDWFYKSLGVKKYYYWMLSVLPKGLKRAVVIVTARKK